jgi:hypothetical protein
MSSLRDFMAVRGSHSMGLHPWPKPDAASRFGKTSWFASISKRPIRRGGSSWWKLKLSCIPVSPNEPCSTHALPTLINLKSGPRYGELKATYRVCLLMRKLQDDNQSHHHFRLVERTKGRKMEEPSTSLRVMRFSTLPIRPPPYLISQVVSAAPALHSVCLTRGAHNWLRRLSRNWITKQPYPTSGRRPKTAVGSGTRSGWRCRNWGRSDSRRLRNSFLRTSPKAYLALVKTMNRTL